MNLTIGLLAVAALMVGLVGSDCVREQALRFFITLEVAAWGSAKTTSVGPRDLVSIPEMVLAMIGWTILVQRIVARRERVLSSE